MKKVDYDKRQSSLKKLGFWCFNPGLGFNKLNALEPLSIILTSGTLSPMSSFATELKTDFSIKVEWGHVIPKTQFSVNILTQGTNLSSFNFTYKERDNQRMLQDLGESILKIWKFSPGGILCFFPSYSFMNNFKDLWNKTGILWKVQQVKEVYFEPSNARKCKSIIRKYYKAAYQKGALLMAVWRGKISEGLDFSDDAARTVIQIGIPFPMLKDPKTMMKKRYLDKINLKDSSSLTGKEWYNLQATRAFNQAIGRVIRHKEDYGNIILIDERFAQAQYNQQVSKWLRDSIEVHHSFSQFEAASEQFFDEVSALDLQPKPQFELEDDYKLSIDQEVKRNSIENSSEEEWKEEKEMIDEDDEVNNSYPSVAKPDLTLFKNSSFKRSKRTITKKESKVRII